MTGERQALGGACDPLCPDCKSFLKFDTDGRGHLVMFCVECQVRKASRRGIRFVEPAAVVAERKRLRRNAYMQKYMRLRRAQRKALAHHNRVEATSHYVFPPGFVGNVSVV